MIPISPVNYGALYDYVAIITRQTDITPSERYLGTKIAIFN